MQLAFQKPAVVPYPVTLQMLLHKRDVALEPEGDKFAEAFLRVQCCVPVSAALEQQRGKLFDIVPVIAVFGKRDVFLAQNKLQVALFNRFPE
jgi:hypothetical protein